MMLLAIAILIATLVMLLSTKPVRSFGLIRWVVVIANVALMILCAAEVVQSL